MRIIKGINKLRTFKKSSVTVGVFDGVHIGHKRIIDKVVRSAKRENLTSVVLTFDPHPMKALGANQKVPSLISLKHRIKLIEALGVDYLAVINFTKSFSRITAEKFFSDVLIKKIHAKIIYAGTDFCFGRGAAGGAQFLKKLSGKYGFKLEVVRPVKVRGMIVSSSAIRRYILQGKLEKAARLLGRPVSILGTVVKGTGLARYLGYPTANVNPHHEVIPPKGVYAVRIVSGLRIYDGILNIGLRPTFFSSQDKEPSVEVHVFGFKGNMYGKDIEIYFAGKVREERKFDTISGLVEQIGRDEKIVRGILSKSPLQNMRRMLI